MNKRRFRNRCFLLVEKSLTLLLVFIFAFGNLGSILNIQFLSSVEEVEAAEVTIDGSAQTSGVSHFHAGPQTVFISDQTGYKFYRDSLGECVYSKTANGGASWGAAVIVDSQTDCLGIAVWYDRWTPGDTGDYIHIATYDSGTDDVFYNRLDTTTDTRLTGSTAVSGSVGSGQGGTLTLGTSYPSITKGTDGTAYIAIADGADAYVVECSSSCNLTGSWSETGTLSLDAANEPSILIPLLSGNIMLINRDISADDIRTRIWNNSTWSAWTTVDANANDNTTYDIGMSATVDDSGNVYLAYTAGTQALGTDDEVRTALYTGTWATRTDALTATAMGVTGTAISRDESSGNIYVAYSAQPTTGLAGNPANVYWKMSTDDMATWGSENGPVNTATNDIYGVDLNISSNQRVYMSWFGVTGQTIYGDTIADLIPGVVITTNGSQTSTLNAPVTDTHIGGSFVVTEYVNSRDVTAVTLTENGTIDGSTEVENVRLYYENDSVAPYDCASVSFDGTGVETPFGSPDTNGFSGADGTSAFSGSTASVSTTSSLCFYVVLDVKDNANSGDTLNVTIANPPSDMTVTNSGEVGPVTAVDISGSTTVLNDVPTQTHFHFRNDNGGEATSTSRTGGSEDTNLSAIQQNTPFRLRVGVSNEGGASTPSIQYRLEYAVATSTCDAATGWIDVGASSDDINMSPTANLNEGDNTTDIAIGTGGVSDENTSYQGTNGAVRDVTSQTGGIVLSSTQYVDLEYSIVATASATEGNSYCFRVTDAGTPLSSYSIYPRATIAADVAVTVSGSQTSTTNIPTTDYYIGGQFVITENSSSRTVTSITITENGTVDASTGLDNIRLRYDLDTSVPYDCASESYAGTDSLFGSSDTDGFSGSNGTSTFTGTAAISTTAAMCVYAVVDVLGTALNGETLNVVLQNPSTDVVVSGGGSVSPSVTRDITGETTLQGAILTQSHYHWRSDNGSESTADSLTGGTQDTPISNIAQSTQVRLRMEVSNEGAVTSGNTALRLEYGTKVTTCENVSSWTDVGAASGAWDMFATANLTEGGDTTNVALGADGAVTDENTTFKSPNSAVKDTSSQIATTTFTSSEYLEAEFSIRQTSDAAYDATYCFRLSNAGSPLNAYPVYPELTTSAERDFEIQRGTVTVSGTGVTLTAGVDYVAPSSLSNAFVRITNSHYTGAGDDNGGVTQNTDDVTAYISNPQNLLTSFTITRPSTAISNTHVSWEIVEFIGTAGSDNEMIVRGQGTATYGTTATTLTGTAVGGIADDADVVVFITGQLSPDTAAADYNTVQSTSAWLSGSDQPQFTRGEASGDAVIVSYAVVEFTGVNWKVQRAEHTYTLAGTTETENITAVNSLSRTFVHSQKRIGTNLPGTDEFGHEVWLSSIGAVSFFLESGATTPSGQTSVAWIIENTQTSNGAMVVTRSDGSTNGGVEPLSLSVSIGTTLDDITNASIFATTRGAGTGTLYPRPMAGFSIASTTHYQLWRSDTGTAVSYRVEVVEWPTAGLAFRQNDYRFYVDSDELDPIDPWPAGVADLGENTVITGADEPLGDGERIRIRMSLTVLNSTLPIESKSFKLQYGERVTTCGAIAGGSWVDVGAIASGAIWRGYDATNLSDGAALSGDPATAGDLNLAVSDTAGTLEEENVSSVNPYIVQEGDDIEYDWIVEQNGATAETFYCFRMIESNDTVLATYADYPTLITSSFTPRTQNWRWYVDEENETPASAPVGENIAPIDIANNDALKLRVTVKEIENIARDDVRFKLQYSEYSDFATAYDVVASSSPACTASSTWCYYDGGGNDNAVINGKVLSDSDACAAGVGDGCGTHNESSNVITGFRHENGAATEYEFTIVAKAPRANAVYYFRLYDVVQDIPVAINTSETYPSLVIEGASLVFNIGGVNSGTVIDGVTITATSTATAIPFETLVFDAEHAAAYQLNINTNATEGYQVLMYADQQLLNAYGEPIPSIGATNATPTGWGDIGGGCLSSMTGCFGYHTTDGNLKTGNISRFGAPDSYAGLQDGSPDEIMYSSIPANDTHDIVYRLRVGEEQPAGQYQTTLTYIAIPVY
jgi:hypothetical protein